ncbi:MAG: hypothetical protein ACKVZJ_13415 [Phycisphaerales bacterium]
MVPDDVAFFFAVDDSAELRRGPIGGFARALIDGVAGFTQTFTAWDRLAKDLDWKPDEAFDALLGRRVVFAARSDPAAPGAGRLGPWVLMSEVSSATARRLTERLRPMPRELVAGTPVLSVEGGRFQLGLARRGADDDDGFLLMLAESSGAALLEQSLREAKGGPARSLGATPAADQLRASARAARAIVYADFSNFAPLGAAPDDADAPRALKLRVGAEEGWMVAGIWPVAEGVRFEVAIHAPDLEAAARRQARRFRNSWDPAAFQALARDAVFVSIESNISVEDEPWSKTFAEIANGLSISLDLPRRASLTGRLAMLLVESPAGIFDGAVALETGDIAALPEIGDAEMARMLAELRARNPLPARDGIGPGQALAATNYDYAGVAPRATRSLGLSGVVGPAIDTAWDDGARLIWRFDPSPPAGAPHDDGQAADQARNEARVPAEGWWTMGLGESAVEQLSRARLLGPAQGLKLDWVTMTSARPRALVERLESRRVPIMQPLEPARWVTRVNWFSALGPQPGLIIGGGRVEISPPPAAVVPPRNQAAPQAGTRTTTPAR